MLNPYASVVLEEVIQSCNFLAEEFANIKAIQASNENEKNKKCMQWQGILHQIDSALNFIDILSLTTLIKIQIQVLLDVAKGDLASSTQLFTSLSEAQRTTSLFLEMRLEGIVLYPTALFSVYQSIHEIIFQDQASAAHFISLQHEAQLPITLKTVSQVGDVGIDAHEIGLLFESALLIFLKNESTASIQAAAEKIANLFSRIAELQKIRNIGKSDNEASREQLYSQIFQVYAQKIFQGVEFDLHVARKIFSALRKKIHHLSTQTNSTFRDGLLQEVLFEIACIDNKDDADIEIINYFDIEPQLQMLKYGPTIWHDMNARMQAWHVFTETVLQTKNLIVDNFSLAQSTDTKNNNHIFFQEVLENLIKAVANSEESLTDILVSLRSMFDTSSIDEIEIVHFLAFVLLIEQIANNNKHWEFSEKNKSHLKIILSDVQLSLLPSTKKIKLGRLTQYFERRSAEKALLSSLQLALIVLEAKLDGVVEAGSSEREEKLINKILIEIISVLNFLDKKELILECSELKNEINKYLNQGSENHSLIESVIRKFLEFEKNCKSIANNIDEENTELAEFLFKHGEQEAEQGSEQGSVSELEQDGSYKNEIFNQAKDVEQIEMLVNISPCAAPDPLIASPALQKIYLKEAQQLVNQLTNAVHDWLTGPDEHALLLASHSAHSLAGSSATVGLPGVSALSAALEQVLHVLNDDTHAEVKSSGLLADCAKALTSQLQQIKQGCVPDAQLDLVKKLYALKEQLVGEVMVGAPIFILANDIEEISIDENISYSLEQTELLRNELHDADFSDHEVDAELVAIFIEEAADYIPQLDILLRNWGDNSESTTIPPAVLRILHTLKGSARMAGCYALGQQFHAMETQVEQLTQLADYDGAKISHLLQEFDLVITTLASIKNKTQQDDGELFPQLVNQIDNQAKQQQDAQPVTPVNTTAAPQESSLVRVRSEVLDRLAGSAAELIVDGARLRSEIQQHKKSLLDLTDTLIRLRTQLRECELVAESSMASKMQSTQPLDFDPLEFDRFTRLQELTRMMAESMNDTVSIERSLSRHVEKTQTILFSHEKYARAIQGDLKRVRFVRFSSVSERLHHLVRQVARESQREIKLSITGAHTEIDRSLLEKIISPIEHLLRNAITHGIESSDDRLHAAKDQCGNIVIHLIQQGNEIIITVSDDGRGLDFERIEQRAKAMGLLPMDANANQDELTEFIFTPGFSTSAELTAIAGRGIGMDAVRETILSQRGAIQVKSQVGLGVTFTLFLPLTLATAAVVLILHGDKQLALPANMVEQVLQLSWSDIKLARQSGELMWRNIRLPLFRLAILLEDGESTESELTNTSHSVIILRGVHGQLALEVQAILGNGEVVVRNIGPQASSVQGIVGASVMPDGSLVLIINPLLFLTTEQQVRRAQPSSFSQTSQIFKMLVVDDSLTVRRISQRLLERAGFTVLLARDGLHAIEILQTELPSVILLDIEMPRMDGFELLHYLRQDSRTKGLPVVMITSRTAEKHRKHAMELGATAYLGKPFNETELLTLLKDFA